jgi:hypothetical protein
LAIFARFNQAAGLRILVLRQQLTVYKAQDEKANPKKSRSMVLGPAIVDMEGLGIGTDPGEARDRNPMEEEKISRIMAKEITRETGQTSDTG